MWIAGATSVSFPPAPNAGHVTMLALDVLSIACRGPTPNSRPVLSLAGKLHCLFALSLLDTVQAGYPVFPEKDCLPHLKTLKLFPYSDLSTPTRRFV